MSGLEWALCSVLGEEISSLDQRSGGEVEIELNGARRARVTVSLEEEAAERALAFASTLKVWLNGVLIFFGPVNLPRQLGGDRTMELAAVDLSERLARSYTGPLFAKSQLAVDQSEIIGRLVDYANVLAVALGSPGGTSGIIRGSLPASTARDRFYPDGSELWASIVAMSEVSNGPDFELEPLDRTDGVYCRLNTYVPFQGSDKTAECVFTFNTQENNASDFTYEPGGGEIVNRAIFAGQAQEGEPSPAWVAWHPASIAENGLWDHFEALPDVKYTAQLQEYAETLVATRARPVDFFDLTPAVEAGGGAQGWVRDGEGWGLRDAEYAVPPPFGPPAAGGAYWIGDEIRAIGRDGGLDRDVVGRVTYAKLSEVGEHGQLLATELTCAPHIDASGVSGSATTVSTEDL
jgi:hypothetical protein